MAILTSLFFIDKMGKSLLLKYLNRSMKQLVLTKTNRVLRVGIDSKLDRL